MKTKKAVLGTAKRNEAQNTLYLEAANLSNLKTQIGEILMFGNKKFGQFKRINLR